MNRFTLTFQDQQLEDKFQQAQVEIYFKQFTRLLIALFLIIILPTQIINLIHLDFKNLMYKSTAIPAFTFFYCLSTRFPRYLNLWISAFNVVSTVALCIQTMKGINNLDIDKYDYFYFGAISYTHELIIQFLSSNFILTIKSRREIFLYKNYEKVWSQIVQNGISFPIMTLQYDKNNNSLKICLINNQARKVLKIHNENDFKLFTRQTYIVDNFDDTQQQNHLNESKDYQLENIFTFHQQKKNNLENSIINFFKEFTHSLNTNQLEKSQNLNALHKKMSKQIDEESCHKKEITLNGIYKKNDEQKEKFLSIKMTVFQNQNSYDCCLVVNEESDNQKIKKTIITTQQKQILQLLLNFVQNSIFTNSGSSKTNEKSKQQSNITTQKQKRKFSDLEDLAEQKMFQSNIFQQRLKRVSTQRDQQSIQLSKVNSNSLEQQDANILERLDLTIQTEIIKGKNELSDVIKISITDNNNKIITNLDYILSILNIFKYKYLQISNKQFYFNQIGLQVNYQIIRKLGPFQNFFIKYQENQGFEIHFYIFKDLSLLNNNGFNDQRLFTNPSFQEQISQSLQNYYHLDNMDRLKDTIFRLNNETQSSNIQFKNQQTINKKMQVFNQSQRIEEFKEQNSQASTFFQKLPSSQNLEDQIQVSQFSTKLYEQKFKFFQNNQQK
ncbi:hypothetical protein ABPG74_007835 [Tetrahymena malaccensis]